VRTVSKTVSENPEMFEKIVGGLKWISLENPMKSAILTALNRFR
jgi:hypothetical protein